MIDIREEDDNSWIRTALKALGPIVPLEKED